MENCFVNKLKGSFNNDNLPYYDVLYLELSSSDTSSRDISFFASGKSFEIYAITGQVTTSNGTPVSNPYNTPSSYSQGLKITPGTKIRVRYKSQLMYLTARNKIEFKTTDIAYCTKMVNLSINDSKITGNIKDLALLVNTTEINALRCSLLTGTIEEFAQAQVSAGRNSGTLKISIAKSQVTYNGSVMDSGWLWITYSSGSYTISTTDPNA
jgi:hypothetical protein